MSKQTIDLIKEAFPNRSFSTQEAMGAGISKRMLTYLSKKGLIERVGRGVYTLAGFEGDEDFQYMDLVHTAKSYKDAVICLLSALSYWELTDEIPRQFWLAIPNNQPTPKTDKKIKFYRPRNLNDGVTEKRIAGVAVRITTPERSVVETFKYFDEETGLHALESYLSQEAKTIRIEELLELAQTLRATKVIDLLRKISTSQAKNYPQLTREALDQSIQWLSEKRKAK